jgi:hypothetical protein
MPLRNQMFGVADLAGIIRRGDSDIRSRGSWNGPDLTDLDANPYKYVEEGQRPFLHSFYCACVVLDA